MSLSHDGYAFGGSSLHGDVVPQGSFQPQLIAEEFFGVKGEAHLLGETGARDLVCEYTLSGFASAALLKVVLDEIDSKVGELTGTLTQSGNINVTYVKCTFVAYERGNMFLDGSGVNGWVCRGRLRWRQRQQA